MTDDRNAPYAAFLLRLTLGVAFLAHSVVLKLMTFGLGGTVAYFQSLGLPAVSAHVVIAAEIIGGAMLIAGVQTRYAALALLPVLLGAVWVHSGNGWMFGSPNGGWEFPAFWSVALVVQALLGDGAYALSPSRPLAALRPSHA